MVSNSPAPASKHQENNHSLRYLVFAVAVAAVSVAIWSLNARLTKLRLENSALRTSLRAAETAVIPHSQDPVARAIRLLSADFENHREVVQLLISRWGTIGIQVSPSASESLDNLGMEVLTFHCEYPSSTPFAAPSFNTTIAILCDLEGNVIDTFHYDSDVQREAHRLDQVGPATWVVAVGPPPRKGLGSGLHWQRPSLYRCWKATKDGFSEFDSPTLLGLNITRTSHETSTGD